MKMINHYYFHLKDTIFIFSTSQGIINYLGGGLLLAKNFFEIPEDPSSLSSNLVLILYQLFLIKWVPSIIFIFIALILHLLKTCFIIRIFFAALFKIYFYSKMWNRSVVINAVLHNLKNAAEYLLLCNNSTNQCHSKRRMKWKFICVLTYCIYLSFNVVAHFFSWWKRHHSCMNILGKYLIIVVY